LFAIDDVGYIKKILPENTLSALKVRFFEEMQKSYAASPLTIPFKNRRAYILCFFLIFFSPSLKD